MLFDSKIDKIKDYEHFHHSRMFQLFVLSCHVVAFVLEFFNVLAQMMGLLMHGHDDAETFQAAVAYFVTRVYAALRSVCYLIYLPCQQMDRPNSRLSSHFAVAIYDLFDDKDFLMIDALYGKLFPMEAARHAFSGDEGNDGIDRLVFSHEGSSTDERGNA